MKLAAGIRRQELLLERLRGLYEVALAMRESATPMSEGRMERPAASGEEQEDLHAMARMSAMAAMQPEGVTPQPAQEPEPVKETEPEVVVVPEPEPVVIPEPEPVVIEPEVVDAPEPETEEMPSVEELEQTDNALLFDEVIIEPESPAPAPVAEKKAEQAVQGSLLDYLNQPSAPTVGEHHAGRTLGESLGAERPQPTRLERKVDDLRTVININDKFSFMSELFHNNMKSYNDFIMSLNALTDRDEAMARVRDVAAQQHWDDESATVQAFYRVFDKKF